MNQKWYYSVLNYYMWTDFKDTTAIIVLIKSTQSKRNN